MTLVDLLAQDLLRWMDAAPDGLRRPVLLPLPSSSLCGFGTPGAADRSDRGAGRGNEREGDAAPSGQPPERLELAREAEAKRALIPSENKRGLADVPDEILNRLQPVFCTDPINARDPGHGA